MDSFEKYFILTYMAVGQVVLVYHLYQIWKYKRSDFWGIIIVGLMLMIPLYAVFWPMVTVGDIASKGGES